MSAAVVLTDAEGRRIDTAVGRRPPSNCGPETFTRPPKRSAPTRPARPPTQPDKG